jgi:acetyltransferase-like isoleucine patch superfamily enzyme
LLLGKVRTDFLSIYKCSFGENIIFRGALNLIDSALIVGDNLAFASSSELAAHKSAVIEIGDRVSVGPRSIISTTNGVVKIGNGTSFFSDCIISGTVSIGNGCLFANNVTVLSGTHQIRGGGTIRENDAAYECSSNYQASDPIIIEDDCWLGANSVILPGVRLGKGTVVGANTVVTKNSEDYAILGGVPARVIGSRLSKS